MTFANPWRDLTKRKDQKTLRTCCTHCNAVLQCQTLQSVARADRMLDYLKLIVVAAASTAAGVMVESLKTTTSSGTHQVRGVRSRRQSRVSVTSRRRPRTTDGQRRSTTSGQFHVEKFQPRSAVVHHRSVELERTRKKQVDAVLTFLIGCCKRLRRCTTLTLKSATKTVTEHTG